MEDNKGFMKEKSTRRFNFFFNSFCASIGLFVFFSAMYRAATTGITYDEAFTYIYYARNLDFKSLPEMYTNSLANNHWLNTILIWLSQQVTHREFNELTIRIPNLVFYVVFLFVSYLISKDKKERFLIFSLLTLNYYLHEFFGLGRGYGISASLTLAGLYFFDLWRQELDNGNRARWIVFVAISCFTLAVCANTIALLVLAAGGLAACFYIVRSGNMKAFISPNYLLPAVLLITVNVLMVIYHFNVSKEGKPLFAADVSFYEAVVLGYVRMFLSSNSLAIAIVIFITFTMLVWREKLINRHFLLVFIIHLLLIVIVTRVSNKGYPIERVLLPSFPLFALAFTDCVAVWHEALERAFSRVNQYPYYASVNIVLVVLMLFLFFKKYDLNATRDWHDDYRWRDLAYQTLALRKRTTTDDLDTPAFAFYTLKFKFAYHINIMDYP